MRKRNMLFWVFFALFSGEVLLSAQGADEIPVYEEDQYDVGVEAIVMRVLPLGPKIVMDAVENDPEKRADSKAVVSFRVLRVFRGELGKIPVGGPSRFEQMKEAAQDRAVMKILTLDFENPEEEIEKEWLKIAVRSPEESFGIKDWDNPGDKKIKLYLKRVPERPDSYLFIRADF